jgi:CBS domain-containing protein
MRIGRIIQKDLEERGIVSVRPDVSVYEALETMKANGIGSVLVMTNDHLEGIFTERDYAYEGELEGRVAKETLVAELMTPSSEIKSVPIDASLSTVAGLMIANNIRHVVYLKANGEVVGIISQRDIVAYLHEDLNRLAMDYFGYDPFRS